MQQNPSERFLQDRVEHVQLNKHFPRLVAHLNVFASGPSNPQRHQKSPPAFSSEDVLGSHTFPIFKGTGTVVRRRGGVRFAPSIWSSSPRPLVWKAAWFIPTCLSTHNARVWSRRQQSAFVLGGVYLFRSFRCSLLPVVPKKCQTSDGGRFWHNPPQTTIAYAPPFTPPKKKATVLFPSTFPINSVFLVRLSSGSERSRLRGVAHRRVLKFKLSGHEGKRRIRAKQQSNLRF